MKKIKLTLSIDEELIKKARAISKINDTSISSMFSEYIESKDSDNHNSKISEKVSRWIGIAKSEKSYKELRDEKFNDELNKYEDIH
jgi:hypothetical protein